jgi:hypothetical protein
MDVELGAVKTLSGSIVLDSAFARTSNA